MLGWRTQVESVIVRFFYDVDRGRTGKITAKQFRQSKFMSVLQAVDEAPDINQVRQRPGATPAANRPMLTTGNAARIRRASLDNGLLFVQALLCAVLPVLGAGHGP